MASPFSTYFLPSPAPVYQQHEGSGPAVAGPSSSTRQRSSLSEAPGTHSDLTSSSSRASQQQSLDYYSSYGLDPAAFSTDISFQMPSFLSGPFAQPPPPQSGPSLMDATMLPFVFDQGPTSMQHPVRTPGGTLRGPDAPKAQNAYFLDPNRPVYGPYGSSVVGVQPDMRPFPAEKGSQSPSLKAQGKARALEQPSTFDPAAIGLPRAIGGNFPGLYSVSGFDLLGVLARVAARPNPQVNVGPVDLSTAFTVVDARRFDLPIVYASETFMSLTGYSPSEVIGRNCRFLQAPSSQEVTAGAQRVHTDQNAVFHMKAHIQSGKESQSSVINYRKDGGPFINLVTIIPISWESDEVAYYVGFQVDVVKQPNAILERMKNGTYTVNYSLVQTDRMYADHIVAAGGAEQPIPQPQGQGVEAAFRTAARQMAPPRTANAPQPSGVVPAEQKLRDLSLTPAEQSPSAQIASTPLAAASQPRASPAMIEMLSGLLSPGPSGQMSPGTAGQPLSASQDVPAEWHQQIVEQCDDLVHIFSIKGSFLYVSPSARRILEYEPAELVGKTVADVCHPADIVPIMRELKESGNPQVAPGRCISILYRIKRKQSDYVWIEAQGKLHIEPGKGRKCVIMVGRQRPLYSMSRSALAADGGVGTDECWAKVTFDGMFLHVTPSVESLLGFSALDMTGFSIFQLTPDNDPANAEIEAALDRARSRLPARVTHSLRNYQGTPIKVISSFFPPINDGELLAPVFAICRICTVEADAARQHASRTDLGASARSGLFAPLPSAGGENVFEELGVSRGTNWQFELHALAKSNKKLREERDMLDSLLQRRPDTSIPDSIAQEILLDNEVYDSDDGASDGSAPLAPLPLPAGGRTLPQTGPLRRADSTDDDSMA